MGLDEVHGPPAVGTEGWLDPYVSDAMAEDRSDVCGDRARLAACFAVTDDESSDLALINACYAVTEGRDSRAGVDFVRSKPYDIGSETIVDKR